MRPFKQGLILLSGLLIFGPAVARAQQPPQADTANLVFEREVFTYPVYQRRNPFIRVVSGNEAGPRFEEVQLYGVIFSPDPGLSVAVFGPRRAGEEGGGGEQQGQRARRVFRARLGEQLGNFRILEIQPSRVVVVVDNFGITEQRIMELQRPGQGGSS